MDKNLLRAEYKKRRQVFKPEQVANKSLQIANQLLSLPLWEKTYFHLFLSSNRLREIDTESVLTLLLGKDKEVIVVGGGNSAVEEALYLTGMASKVYLVHRRDKLRAEKILQKRLFDKKNINVLWNNKVDEILGDDFGVNSLKLISTKDGSETLIKIDGIFIAIGHDPSTLVFKNKIDLDKDNYIITKTGGTATSVPGIFAAGDCVDKIYRQAVTAAGMGCMAALDAEKWLANHK